ncbi:hypothetical protein SEA_LIGMA_21 [Gordonia phage Ligma]|nr:hypothetical protein SEA_LIGMA_21 [Gordonia phage Ligma]UQT02122.1 tail assembly chaperone [Gordonia phage Axumite]
MSARKVTIEGSIQPSDQLARGERRTVALTPRVQRLIDRGFVIVVDDADTEPSAPAPVDPPADDTGAPKLNASREDWAAHLDAQDPPIEYTDDDGRDDLVRLWQGSQQS